MSLLQRRACVVDHGLDGGLQAGERLLPLDGRGAGDDQRRARLVDQNRVHLVHDAEEIVALDLVLLAPGHAVVAQVVEAQLGGGAIGDVPEVHFPSQLTGHELLDAADGDAEKVIDVAHPFGVAAGEVVVGGDELGVAAGQGVEVKRERGHQGFALARGHLGDLALVQRDAADQLHVIVHHVPRQLVFADGDLAAEKAAGGIFDNRESLGQELVQRFSRLEPVAKLGRFGAELIVGERLIRTLDLVDARDDGPAPLDKFAVMAAGEPLQKPGNHAKRGLLIRLVRSLAIDKSRPSRARPEAARTAHTRPRK